MAPVLATQSLRKAAESGERLNLPLAMSVVEQRGGVLRRGHLAMIAGISNAGKSAFAEWLTAMTNLDTLYFSADQDPWTSTTRLAALLTGSTVENAALAIANEEGREAYDRALSSSRLSFCYDSNPSLEDIGLELDAYVETWDAYPDVIVVDNLVNVEGSGEMQEDQFIISELHSLARRTRSCVIVLAHCSEASTKDPYSPPDRKSIINKLSKYPDLIYTVAYNPETDQFGVAVVKTREGKADAKAEHPVWLYADLDRCTFSGTPFLRSVPAYGDYYRQD